MPGFVRAPTPIQVGELFGSWAAVERVERKKDRLFWRVRCICGKETVKDIYSLRAAAKKNGRASCQTCAAKARRAKERDDAVLLHQVRTHPQLRYVLKDLECSGERPGYSECCAPIVRLLKGDYQ